ncbi:MAG: RrF2 family transcriptional regulator [Bacillota bacterium]|jgi:Rrf2 family iron-sulfur cluster assembly transcriptional regulator
MITSKVEYLVLTLLDLAAHSNEGLVISREVAERQGVPAKYMPQIMSRLAKKGWVESVRGPKGGVRLAVDPASVTIQDVIDISDNPLLVKQCVGDDSRCERMAECPLRHVWFEAQDQIERVMRKTTLADLMPRGAV